MKRILAIAAGIAALLGATAVPVLADGSGVAENANFVDNGLKFVEKTVNPLVQNVPTPNGWEDRDVCVILYPVDRSVCVYFPFPF